MPPTSAPLPELAHSTGSFNYLVGRTRPSLYRNGEVLTRRDPDGSDGGSRGVDLEARPMPSDSHRRRRAPGVRRLGFSPITYTLRRVPASIPSNICVRVRP